MLLHGWSSPSKPKMGKQPRIAAKPFSCFISNSRDSSLQCTTLPHLWTISRSTFIVCICFPDWMISLPLWTAPDCRHLWAVEKSIVCTLFALCLHFVCTLQGYRKAVAICSPIWPSPGQWCPDPNGAHHHYHERADIRSERWSCRVPPQHLKSRRHRLCPYYRNLWGYYRLIQLILFSWWLCWREDERMLWVWWWARALQRMTASTQ